MHYFKINKLIFFNEDLFLKWINIQLRNNLCTKDNQK